ncbi:MAG: N-acetylmuramoyl-L-alanine amidase [Nocardioides sp.]|nr:N-acetylmuramoyl-L-alanine amidase [Nocardioides sp.]
MVEGVRVQDLPAPTRRALVRGALAVAFGGAALGATAGPALADSSAKGDPGSLRISDLPGIGDLPGVGDLTRLDLLELLEVDYPSAEWIPAHAGNYTVAARPIEALPRYVIIHDIEGPYRAAVDRFQTRGSEVSAHYVIRSHDGHIAQMVRQKDIAWHAGNWSYNVQAVGIEHEGYVSTGKYYTETMYEASARLTAYVCLLYAIPMTRDHIIGHKEVPYATHTDPGPHWRWNHYMDLVHGFGTDAVALIPKQVRDLLPYV